MRDIMITIKTNHGDISVELFDDKAPISCENFRQYVADGHFTNTIFHRVIPNFMVQGGGMDESMASKPTRDPIKNEADNGESNVRGTLAMARTSVVDSATSQFFINLRDNAFLNHGTRDFGYAVFGKVSDGLDVVDAIGAVSTGNRGGHSDVPVEAVTILEVTIDD
jgi:cyclophilin family peptidyl-prolyl cis-trans isomerase